MIEVSNNLFVGNQVDFESICREEGWGVVQACKEPYHRAALGYTGRAAPKTHPEYLIAKRENRLILNMIDADTMAYIPMELIDSSLCFIHKNLHENKKVLVHCNQGMSRSVGITLLYLAISGRIPSDSFSDAEEAFSKLYPPCAMANGIRDFLIHNWEFYKNFDLQNGGPKSPLL